MSPLPTRPSPGLDRRAFLRRSGTTLGALAAVGVGGSLLAACGSDSESSSSATTGAAGGDLGALALQLNWIKDFQFSGSYIADSEGLYTAAGFTSVDLMSGGPTTAVEPVIESGGALLGYGVTESFAAAVGAGAALKAIGVQLQTNPTAITSLADAPITTPQDMVGKRIGVQASAEPSWQAFLGINGIDPSSLTTVPVQYDASVLTTGDVDGFLSFAYNQPVALEAAGTPVEVMLFADHGMDVFQQLYVCTEDSLENDRDALVAALGAERKGWEANVADPTVGANLAVDQYGADLGLDLELQVEGNRVQCDLMQTDYTEANGLLSMDPDQVDSVLGILDQLGLGIPSEAFTTEILDEL